MSYINREEAIRLIDEYQGGAMDKPTARRILMEMAEAEPPSRCIAKVQFDEDKMKEIVDSAIIRCKDCRWWDKYSNYDNGYCMAAKHNYLSEHWEIRIRRTYKGDFYCADAEPKEEQE